MKSLDEVDGLNNKLKKYLIDKQVECLNKIKKRKKKNKLIKVSYILLITTAIIGNSIILILSSLIMPPIAISCISGVIGVATAISVNFKLQNKKKLLEESIHQLQKIKDKIEYVIQCDGDLTTEQINTIFEEFRNL